jgi:sirohydrochlorin ferrochelatase
MTAELILLIGRTMRNGHEILETHANRLSRRAAVDNVEIATHEGEPTHELKEKFEQISADKIYVVPMCLAHSHATVNSIPAALRYVSGNIHYCEPLGQSPAVTKVLKEKAENLTPVSDDASLILVGFGSSSMPYQRETIDYHAARLRKQSRYEEVSTCYLLQDPTVECVRYNLTKNKAVVVPVFLARSEATEHRIPDKLELRYGNIEYADPLGKHPRITDAIHAEIKKQRTLSADDVGSTASFEAQLNQKQRPIRPTKKEFDSSGSSFRIESIDTDPERVLKEYPARVECPTNRQFELISGRFPIRSDLGELRERKRVSERSSLSCQN